MRRVLREAIIPKHRDDISRPRFKTDAIISINAAYTPAEVKALLETSRFTKFTVSSNPMGLQVTASK